MAKQKNSGFSDAGDDGALNDERGADEKEVDSDGAEESAEELENPDSWELEEDLEE